jgi:hypothetical protein
VPADARPGDDEPALGQGVQVRPAGPHGAQFGESGIAARIDGNDQRVKGQVIDAGLRSPFGQQPVSGAENVDGAGQDTLGGKSVSLRARRVRPVRSPW